MRYHLVFADTWWPSVIVRDPLTGSVVTRVRGFTRTHAFSRAVSWARKHGDPR